MARDQKMEYFTQVFKMMGHPIRLSIIQLLDQQGTLNVGTIVETLGYPQATVSQQLSKLKAGGIVDSERTGTNVNYTLVDPFVQEVNELID